MGHSAFFCGKWGIRFKLFAKRIGNIGRILAQPWGAWRECTHGWGSGYSYSFRKKIKNEYPLRDSGTEYGVHVGAGSRLLKYGIVIL